MTWDTSLDFFGTTDVAGVERCLMAGADPNAQDGDGKTPLHRAAHWNENSAVIAALLKAGADPNARSGSGWTPLHEVAGWNESPAVITTLLEAGANPDARMRKTGHRCTLRRY